MNMYRGRWFSTGERKADDDRPNDPPDRRREYGADGQLIYRERGEPFRKGGLVKSGCQMRGHTKGRTC